MTDKCETHDEAKVCLSCMADISKAFHERWKSRWNMMSIARHLIPIQQLPPGALPVYDRDIDIVAVVLGENKCKAESGAWGQTQCVLDEDHEGAHQNESGSFKWYNEDRPDDDQGWMCSEIIDGQDQNDHGNDEE